MNNGAAQALDRPLYFYAFMQLSTCKTGFLAAEKAHMTFRPKAAKAQAPAQEIDLKGDIKGGRIARRVELFDDFPAQFVGNSFVGVQGKRPASIGQLQGRLFLGGEIVKFAEKNLGAGSLDELRGAIAARFINEHDNFVGEAFEARQRRGQVALFVLSD